MRNLLTAPVARYRRRDADVAMLYGDLGDAGNGAFWLPAGVTAGGYRLASSVAVIASTGDGWEHVSASCRARCPRWVEMMAVHRLFFGDDETTMQLCVPPSHLGRLKRSAPGK